MNEENVKRISFGITKGHSFSFGTASANGVFKINSREEIILTSREIIRVDSGIIVNRAPHQSSTGIYCPTYDALVTVTGVQSEFSVFLLNYDIREPIMKGVPLDQIGIYHVLFDDKNSILVTFGNGIKTWYFECLPKKARTCISDNYANIRPKASFAPYYTAFMMIIPCLDADNRRIFIPTSDGLLCYDYDGNFLPPPLAHNNHWFTMFTINPFTKKMLTSDRDEAKDAKQERAANFKTPIVTQGVQYWRRNGTLSKELPFINASLFAAYFINNEFVVAIDAFFSVHIIDLKTMRFFTCLKIEFRPSHISFENDERDLRLVFCSVSSVYYYNICVPWRLWNLTHIPVTKILRCPKYECAARISVELADSSIRLFTPYSILVTLCHSSNPSSPVATLIDRGSPEDPTRDQVFVILESGLVQIFGANECPCLPASTIPNLKARSIIVSNFLDRQRCILIGTRIGDILSYDYTTLAFIRRTLVCQGSILFMFPHQASKTLLVLTDYRMYRVSMVDGKVKAEYRQDCEDVAALFDDLLVIGYANGSYLIERIYDTEGIEIIHKEKNPLHNGKVVGLSRGSDYFVSAGFDGSVLVWNMDAVILAKLTFPTPIYSIGVHNGLRGLLIGTDAEIMIVDGKLLFDGIVDEEDIPYDNYDRRKDYVISQFVSPPDEDSIHKSRNPRNRRRRKKKSGEDDDESSVESTKPKQSEYAAMIERMKAEKERKEREEEERKKAEEEAKRKEEERKQAEEEEARRKEEEERNETNDDYQPKQNETNQNDEIEEFEKKPRQPISLVSGKEKVVVENNFEGKPVEIDEELKQRIEQEEAAKEEKARLKKEKAERERIEKEMKEEEEKQKKNKRQNKNKGDNTNEKTTDNTNDNENKQKTRPSADELAKNEKAKKKPVNPTKTSPEKEIIMLNTRNNKVRKNYNDPNANLTNQVIDGLSLDDPTGLKAKKSKQVKNKKLSNKTKANNDNGNNILDNYDENGNPIDGKKRKGKIVGYDENGNPIYDNGKGKIIGYDKDGNPIYGTILGYDKDGNPIYGKIIGYDKDGNPIYAKIVGFDENGNPIYADENEIIGYDENGNPIHRNKKIIGYDKDGNPIYADDSEIVGYDENGNPIYRKKKIIGYDKDGNPIYENGNQLISSKDSRTITGYDENGNPIYSNSNKNKKIVGYDENGNPIYENDSSKKKKGRNWNRLSKTVNRSTSPLQYSDMLDGVMADLSKTMPAEDPAQSETMRLRREKLAEMQRRRCKTPNTAQSYRMKHIIHVHMRVNRDFPPDIDIRKTVNPPCLVYSPEYLSLALGDDINEDAWQKFERMCCFRAVNDFERESYTRHRNFILTNRNRLNQNTLNLNLTVSSTLHSTQNTNPTVPVIELYHTDEDPLKKYSSSLIPLNNSSRGSPRSTRTNNESSLNSSNLPLLNLDSSKYQRTNSRNDNGDDTDSVYEYRKLSMLMDSQRQAMSARSTRSTASYATNRRRLESPRSIFPWLDDEMLRPSSQRRAPSPVRIVNHGHSKQQFRTLLSIFKKVKR